MNIARPTYRDPEILAGVARAVLKAMPAGTIADGDQEGAIADITRALRNEAPGFDEYRLTRQLEDCGWGCDRGILDAFEVACGEAHQCVREATKRWVEANGIKPRHTVGDQVRVMVRSRSHIKEEFDGEITKIDAEQANYIVRIPALGHVHEGMGTHGVILPFEDLHPLATSVEEFCLEHSR